MSASDAGLGERLAHVALVALDVDGVLTDGAVVYDGEGEVQSFHVHDGAALVWLRRLGVHVVWITGRGCAATERRAQELGCRLLTRVDDKDAALTALQEELDVPPEKTLAMGDDLPDLGLARRAGIFCAPADARPQVRARAALVTRARGGRGAVREVVEALLEARGLWDPRTGPKPGGATEPDARG